MSKKEYTIKIYLKKGLQNSITLRHRVNQNAYQGSKTKSLNSLYYPNFFLQIILWQFYIIKSQYFIIPVFLFSSILLIFFTHCKLYIGQSIYLEGLCMSIFPSHLFTGISFLFSVLALVNCLKEPLSEPLEYLSQHESS